MPNTKLSFDCARGHATVWEGLLAGFDSDAVVGQEAVSTANGDDLTSGDKVRLVAFFDGERAVADFDAILTLGQNLTDAQVSLRVEVLADQDWVAKSQSGLARLRVARLVIHSPQDKAAIPKGLIPISIQAANAFGTGHHGTTFGCMKALQSLVDCASPRTLTRMKIADVGCGTALLAFAAAKLMRPRTPVIASDIDARAIPTAQDNARNNHLTSGMRFYCAPDVRHSLFRNHRGFDLVFANILSGLLVDMAPRLGPVVKPGGRLILAGLLNQHAITVAKAYQLLGFRLESKLVSGDWSVLTLRRVRQVRARTLQRGDQRFHPLKGGNWMHW